MLKHVSSGTMFPHPNNNQTFSVKYDLISTKVDTISLNSSTSSNDSSLNDSVSEANVLPNRSWSSSSSSIHSFESPKVVIKIYTRVLCTDVEYKTLSIYNNTTCKEIVEIILKKFRLQHRDSNLFYLTLEAWIKQTGIPIRSVMTLEDDACPALLQSCYRQKDLKFTLLMRRGENIKIHNQCIQGPLSVNVLISEKTNVEELIKLLSIILGLTEHHSQYEIYEYSPTLKIQRKLSPSECPVAIRMEWPNLDYNVFQIRPCRSNSSQKTEALSSLFNSEVVDNLKKNLKSEFALTLLSPPIQTNSKGKVLYI